MKPKRRGLTLIEVLVAMVIISIALLAGTTLITASHTATIKGDLYTIASKAASNTISTYEANGYAALTDGTSTSTYTPPTGEETVRGVTMTITTTIGAPSFNTSATNIKEVDVRVSWDPGSSSSSGLAGQVSASTLISAQ